MKLYILILCLTFPFLNGYSQEDTKTKIQLAKGGILISPTFNLDQQSGTNNSFLGTQFDNQYRLHYTINLNTGYFIQDDFAIGLQFGYTNTQHDYTYYPGGVLTVEKYYSNLASFFPNIRNYFGPGILKGFIQTNLGFSFGQGITRTYAEANDTRVDTDTFILTVAIQPGVAVFVADYVSLEVSINLIGLTSEYVRKDFNNGVVGELYKNSLNFDINLLSLNIGLGFYIGTKKKEK